MEPFKAGKITEQQEDIKEQLLTLLEDNAMHDVAQELRQRLASLQQREKIRIAFVGQYSAGKSTIVAALTKKDIAIGTDVTTEESTDYEWGNFLLTDTPGLQNSNEHDAIAKEAIKNADLIVYCITYELFNRYTLSDYCSLAYEKGYANKMILVVNKVNSEESDSREELISNYTESLNRALTPHSLDDVPHCYIDVLDYMKGVEKGRERRVIKSNFEAFISFLNNFLENNGLICKIDTPLRVMKEIVADVMIDESETAEEQMQKTLIARLERDFLNLRAIASRKWDAEVNRQLAEFSEKVYGLFAQIQSGEIADPESAYNSLVAEALESLNHELSVLSDNFEEQCNDKAKEILDTRTAHALFGDINVEAVDAHKTSAAGRLKHEDRKNSNSLVKNTVNDLGQIALRETSKITKEGTKEVILKVGHKLGYKFKPWGATKLASKATKALKCLGPALEIFSVAMDVKDTVDEANAAKEERKARRELYSVLTDTCKDIRDECTAQRKEFINNVFTSRINELEQVRQASIGIKDSNKRFNQELVLIEQAIGNLQNELFGLNN